MPVVYAAPVKTARMTAVRDAIDAGPAAGKLEIGTAGMGTVLATINLADPSGSVSGSVLTLSGLPLSDLSADATGTAAAARIRDSNNNDVITGLTVTLTGGGGDVQVDNTDFVAGQEIRVTVGTITHG